MPDGNVPAFSVDDLIEDFEAEHSGNYDITLQTGRVIIVRDVTDGRELDKMQERAKFLLRSVKRAPNAEWLPYLPASDAVVTTAAYLEAISVEPKLSFVDGLKMGKRAAPLLLEIGQKITDKMTGNVQSVEAAKVDAAKND